MNVSLGLCNSVMFNTVKSPTPLVFLKTNVLISNKHFQNNEHSIYP